MSRRIDIELTSALPDDSWTWRAAGAKQPKGTLSGSILGTGASVGDVIKVEIEQEIDGITVLSVVGGRQKQEREDLLELLPTDQEFKPVIETRAKRDRNDRGRSDRGPRRGRDGRRGDRDGRGGRGDGDGREDRGGGRGDRDRRGGRGDRDRGGGRDGRRGGPSFTPPPEVPQRPKPKRLKPGKKNRNAVLAELPEEQRAVAEVALQGMGAVRQRLREENDRAVAEGRSPMPEATVLKMAEDMLPKLRVAEWRDRAEAAQRQMEHLDLRDLRSVVAAAGDPAVARDETTAALAAELGEALATKQEHELVLWFGDVDAALAVGRVIRALRLSSQPPKAGVPFPSDIAQRLVDSTNASLAPMDSAERWIAMLEAAAFSPIRAAVVPVRKPDEVTDELLATVKRLAPALPQVAALFEVEVDPKAPMPKPLRPGPRNRKDGKGGKGGDRKPPQRRGKKSEGQGTGGRRHRDAAPGAAADTPAADTPAADAPADTANDAETATPPDTTATDSAADVATEDVSEDAGDEAPSDTSAASTTDDAPGATTSTDDAPAADAATGNATEGDTAAADTPGNQPAATTSTDDAPAADAAIGNATEGDTAAADTPVADPTTSPDGGTAPG